MIVGKDVAIQGNKNAASTDRLIGSTAEKGLLARNDSDTGEQYQDNHKPGPLPSGPGLTGVVLIVLAIAADLRHQRPWMPNKAAVIWT